MAITAKDLGKKNIKSTIDRLVQSPISQDLLDLLILQNADQHQRALDVMQFLILNTPEAPGHPYHRFMELLAKSIEEYEDQHFPMDKATPIQVIEFLMEEHRLSQSQLPELGNQAKVSEILKGKRKLNLRQVKALSERFNLPLSVFVE